MGPKRPGGPGGSDTDLGVKSGWSEIVLAQLLWGDPTFVQS